MGRRVHGLMDTATLSAPAFIAQRKSLLLGRYYANAHFRSLYEGLEQRCNHQLQRHTDVRHFRIAGANTNQQLRSSRVHHGRWKSLDAEHRGYRSWRVDSSVEVWTHHEIGRASCRERG